MTTIAEDIRQQFCHETGRFEYNSPDGNTIVEGHVTVNTKRISQPEPLIDVTCTYEIYRYLVKDGNDDWDDSEGDLEKLINLMQ